MRVVMVMKVRDEEDILESNLRFHHALGVDHFYVAENASVDSTPQVLDRYAAAGLATVTRHESDSFSQDATGWIEEMARRAATEQDADWVIHCDADEFWWPTQGSIANALDSIAPEYGVVMAPRTEFVGRPQGSGEFFERLKFREARSSLRPKTAHRGHPEVVIFDRGAHQVGTAADDATRYGEGRAVLRVGRWNRPGDVHLIAAPRWPIRVLHFPIRSLEQIRRRTEVLLAGFSEARHIQTVRERVEAGDITGIYEELIVDDAALEAALQRGELVRDERLHHLMPHCPDPLSGPSAGATVRISPSPDDVEVERAQLERDAMHALSRFQHVMVTRVKRLRERVAELEARADQMPAGDAAAEALPRWARPLPEPEIPPGWTTGPPDFVGVGAQRSGTTWWYRGALGSHPQVTLAADGEKELHFFDRFILEEVPSDLAERYARLFPRPRGAVTGEWTPRYMADFWTLPLLQSTAPDAQLLVMLRDPVERFRSGIARELRVASRRGTVIDLAVVGDALHRSRYHRQLTHVFELFPRERVLVLQYERCRRDPGPEMERTQRFLGLEPLPELPKRLKRERPPRSDRPAFPDELRDRAGRELREDARRVAELCPEIDLSLWPSCDD